MITSGIARVEAYKLMKGDIEYLVKELYYPRELAIKMVMTYWSTVEPAISE